MYTKKVAVQMIDKLILTSMVMDEDGKQIRTINKLNSWDEEADDRGLIHTGWAIKNGAKQIIAFSNDSDTLILLLWYILPTILPFYDPKVLQILGYMSSLCLYECRLKHVCKTNKSQFWTKRKLIKCRFLLFRGKMICFLELLKSGVQNHFSQFTWWFGYLNTSY